jgi:hypothetical protein
MPDFDTSDPNTSAFWDERFERGFMPWDRGGVPEALRGFVARADRPLTTLIPGCGEAYELSYLSKAGWPVTAIDFSATAVEKARAGAGQWADRIEQADFFAWKPHRALDFIYERAFLCALPPSMRPAVAGKWADLLPPGAFLGGYFFFADTDRGPPFGIAPEQLDALLTPNFVRIEDMAVTDSIDIFRDRERWQLWQRRG